jgi:hypothetical protein
MRVFALASSLSSLLRVVSITILSVPRSCSSDTAYRAPLSRGEEIEGDRGRREQAHGRRAEEVFRI